MDVKITPISEKSQVEMEISVPAGDFEVFLEKAAKKLSKETKIKGFRPGKAPVATVAEVVGQERLLHEAMDSALPHFFVQAAMDNDVSAINRPNVAIKSLGIGSALEFTATVDVLPEVTLGDPKKLKVEKRDVAVDDEQIDKEIEYVAKMRGTLLDVARPAEKGDTVTLDFDVKINGVTIEGGESKNHPVTIGDGHFVPDFEKGITGVSTGDLRDFEMTFPEDYMKEDLRGKTAQVTVKAHSVQKRTLPKIDDEFAKGLGKFESLADLKTKLRENMEHEMTHKEEDRFFGEIAEQLAEASEFGHIPEVLTEKEIDNRIQEFTQMLEMQQRTIEDYLQKEEKTLEQMRTDMKPAAEKNVKVGLTLRRFAEQEKIAVTQEEIEMEATKQLAQYNNPEEAAKNVDMEALQDHVEAVLRNRKTLKRLSELIEEK